MKYTNHFKKLIKEKTELTDKQIDLMFEIMNMESQIAGMKKMKPGKKGYSSHQADTLIFNTQMKLDELTGNKNSEEIFEENYVKIVDSELSVRATNDLFSLLAEKLGIEYFKIKEYNLSELKNVFLTELKFQHNIGNYLKN